MGKIADIIKSSIGHLEFFSGGWKYRADELLVLCMHSTPADRMKSFAVITDDLLKHFKPLHPNQLEAYYRGELQEGPYVLFTFDDGLKNNLPVAEFLHSRGLGAFFFLVPDFISSNEQMLYYRKNIRPIIDPTLDKLDEDFSAMSQEDVLNLLKHGHQIGSHTMSHLLRNTATAEEVNREVVESQKLLKAWFGCDVNSFCSVIQTTISVNAMAKSAIEQQYKFHFTTFPGLNGAEKNPRMIFRRNIEVNWSKGKIRFALGQWDLRRWKPQILHFLSLR